MYNQGFAVTDAPVAPSFMNQLLDTLRLHNDEQEKELSEVKGRLQKFSSRSLPQEIETAANSDVKIAQDMSICIGAELERLRITTDKIRNIRQHLFEIL